MSRQADTRRSSYSSLIPRNINVSGRRTSVRLESAMWAALRDIAARRGATIDQLASEIDATRTASSLTAAIRIFIVEFYRSLEKPSSEG